MPASSPHMLSQTFEAGATQLSFWFLGCANCFHALAPSHVLCPLSGNFSALFGGLPPTHPSGTSLMSPLQRNLPQASILVSPHLHLTVWYLSSCFPLSPFPNLQGWVMFFGFVCFLLVFCFPLPYQTVNSLRACPIVFSKFDTYMSWRRAVTYS